MAKFYKQGKTLEPVAISGRRGLPRNFKTLVNSNDKFIMKINIRVLAKLFGNFDLCFSPLPLPPFFALFYACKNKLDTAGRHRTRQMESRMILTREVHSSGRRVYIGVVKACLIEERKRERKKKSVSPRNRAIKLATYIRQMPPIYAWYRINYAR